MNIKTLLIIGLVTLGVLVIGKEVKYFRCVSAQKGRCKPVFQSWDKVDYQDTFFIGCMNAYIHFDTPKNGTAQLDIKRGADWCKKKKSEMDAHPL